MPYLQTIQECAGRPVIQLVYEPTYEEWQERQSLHKGVTASDECNFFSNDHEEIPFSDEPTFEESRAEYQELLAYTGEHF